MYFISSLTERLSNFFGFSTSVEDNESKALQEKSLSGIFYKNRGLHEAVEKAAFMGKLRNNELTKEEYGQYLVNLKYELGDLENRIKKAKIPNVDVIKFDEFSRLQALDLDIQKLGMTHLKPDAKLEKHIEHYKSLREERAKLLIIYPILRYFAIVHGGQPRSKLLQEEWGCEAPVHLYRFSEDSNVVRKKLVDQVNEFGKTLTSEDYTTFKKEIKNAWVFVGDVLGVDIRRLVNSEKD